MMASTDVVLTTVSTQWTTELSDAVRILDWSPRGRLLAVTADGRALVDRADQITAPISPDPRGGVWLGDRGLAVVDPILGVVTSGFDRAEPCEFAGASCIGTHGGRTVVAGDGRVAVFGHPGIDAAPEVVWTGVGTTHALAHVDATLWAVGGTTGLALVDVALGCLDTRLDFPGVIAVAAAGVAGRLVVADLACSVHVLELERMGDGVELTGYSDPVRHLTISCDGRVAVGAADDQLTSWSIDAHGVVSDAPTCVVAHDATITSLESSRSGFLASGDEAGVVHIWSPLLSGHPVATLRVDGEVTALAWSHDGAHLACGSVSGDLLVADVVPGVLA